MNPLRWIGEKVLTNGLVYLAALTKKNPQVSALLSLGVGTGAGYLGITHETVAAACNVMLGLLQ